MKTLANSMSFARKRLERTSRKEETPHYSTTMVKERLQLHISISLNLVEEDLSSITLNTTYHHTKTKSQVLSLMQMTTMMTLADCQLISMKSTSDF